MSASKEIKGTLKIPKLCMGMFGNKKRDQMELGKYKRVVMWDLLAIE
jgi:hypothetical protein